MTPADGDDGSPRLQLRGFDAASALFSLRVRPVTGLEDAQELEIRDLKRDWSAWRAWDRALRKARDSPPKLPIRKLRRLMERSWVRDDAAAGWRVEMTKSADECEIWLNAALARLPAAERAEFLSDELHGRAQKRRREEREAVRNAKDLQQYFTNPALVRLEVEMVWEALRDKQIVTDSVVFLEPSFGDGRVARALLANGASKVVGYEIDEGLHRQAADGCDPNCELLCGDFLASKRADVGDLEALTQATVVVVANPPYGDKKEDTGEPGHAPDLVLRFMAHAAAEWRAELMALIVPERCSKPAYVQAALDALSEATPDKKWELEQCRTPDDCTFELGANKRVKQPSVLQLFASRARE